MWNQLSQRPKVMGEVSGADKRTSVSAVPTFLWFSKTGSTQLGPIQNKWALLGRLTYIAQQRQRSSCCYLTVEGPILQSGVCWSQSQKKKRKRKWRVDFPPCSPRCPWMLPLKNQQLYLAALPDICCRQSFVIICHKGALPAAPH